MKYKKSKINKSFSISFLLFAYLFSNTLIPALSDNTYAENITDSEALILDSAEKFFISLKESNYKAAWDLLTEKSHKTIIDDVYTASKKIGVEIREEDIIEDFNSNGIMSNNYWKAILNNFNPDIVLNERVWEFEKIEPDHAIILLKNKNGIATKLQIFNKNRQWKVGFVETFWQGKTIKIINYLNSLLF